MSQEVGKECGDHNPQDKNDDDDDILSETENSNDVLLLIQALSSTHSKTIHNKKKSGSVLKKVHRNSFIADRRTSFKTRSLEVRRIKMSYIVKYRDYESLKIETTSLQDGLKETLNSLNRIRNYILNVHGKDLGEVEELELTEDDNLEMDSFIQSTSLSLYEEKNSFSINKHKVKLLNARDISLGLPKRFLVRFQRRINELLQRISEINKESAIVTRRFIQWAEDESVERKRGEHEVEKAKDKFFILYESRSENHKKSVEMLRNLHKLLKSTHIQDENSEDKSSKLSSNSGVYIESWKKLDKLKGCYTMQKSYLKTICDTHSRIMNLIDKLNNITIKRLYSYHLDVNTKYQYQHLTSQEIALWKNTFNELDKIKLTGIIKNKDGNENLIYNQINNLERMDLLKMYIKLLEDKLNRLQLSFENCQDKRKNLIIFLKNNEDIREDNDINNEITCEKTLFKEFKEWLLGNKHFYMKISSNTLMKFYNHSWNFQNLFNFLIGGAEIFSLQNHVNSLIKNENGKRNKITQLDGFLYDIEEEYNYHIDKHYDKLTEALEKEIKKLKIFEKYWKVIKFEAYYADCKFNQNFKSITTNENILLTSDESSDDDNLNKNFEWPNRFHEDLETLLT